MFYRRKCFNITLKDTLHITQNNGHSKALKSFSLLSLSMDNYYFRNRLAYELLKKTLDIDIFHTFFEVKINNQTQGVYLLIENPKKHLSNSINADLIIRRRYECSSFGKRVNIEDAQLDYSFDKTLNSKKIQPFLKSYRDIYRLLNNKKGQELYNSLNLIMNIDEYMKIMAFNFIICNGDYTDEQFFYIKNLKKDARFNILPWDFDDIFLNFPHEGWKKRDSNTEETKLIFSIESDLDLAISNDSYLYSKYLENLDAVIKNLDTID